MDNTKKCPKCKEKIEHLNFNANVQHSGIYEKDYINGENWDTRNLGDWSEIEFFCPHCNILITDSQEVADKYFN